VWPFPDGSSRCLRVVEVTFQPEAATPPPGVAMAVSQRED
jgi:hypothetical protein